MYGRSRFAITGDPIDPSAEAAHVGGDREGAVVTFEGRVRNHNGGKPVQGLTYSVYEELANTEGEAILARVVEQFEINDARCVHRVGDLSIGDIAVIVVVAAGHRDAAFDACRLIVDQVKERLPIWKKEHYLERSEWVYPTESSG